MEKATLGKAVREALVDEIKRIELIARCDAESLLLSSDDFDKFVVIRVTLKHQDCSSAVFSALDRAIPYPTIFEIVRSAEDEFTALEHRLVMGYKECSFEEASSKVSKLPQLYIKSSWMSENPEGTQNFPLALSVREIYEQIYKNFVLDFGAESIPIRVPSHSAKESKFSDVAQMSAHQLEVKASEKVQLQNDIDKLKKRWKREKQHNRKTQIRNEIIRKQKQLSDF